VGAAVLGHLRRRSNGKPESVTVGVLTERIDKPLAKVFAGECLVAEAEVDVLRQSCRIAEADLEGHAPL
jgi:hypothetical protein